MEEQLEVLLQRELGSLGAVDRDSEIGLGRQFRPDLVIDTGRDLFVVEAKLGAADFQDVSQLMYYRSALAHQRQVPPSRVKPVLVASSATSVAIKMLSDAHGRFILWNPERGVRLATGSRITSPRAWAVVSQMLALGPQSILQVAQQAGVSYAWSHRVVANLIARGIARRQGGKVEIVEKHKLLDGVAWERPFSRLLVHSFEAGFRDPIQAATEISRRSHPGQLDVAFTGLTAGALYTNYARAFRLVQCYCPFPADLQRLLGTGSGVRVEVFSPDREVFRGSLEIRGVRLVSPSVALLDLGGLGYSARDLALAAVDAFAQIAEYNRGGLAR